MTALPFVWPYALVFWLAYFWSFASEYRIVSGAIDGVREVDSPDRGSLRLLLGAQMLAQPDQPVIRSGPYRLVRHPSYTGGMLIFVGIGFALGSVLGLILLAVTTLVGYGYRVAVEERALMAAIGEPYRIYMNECKRFIPYIV